MNFERAVPIFESLMRAADENRPLFSSQLWEDKKLGTTRWISLSMWRMHTSNK